MRGHCRTGYKANDLILSTVAASEDDWENLQNIDSAKAQGAISMEKGAGIEVHGALKTQSTTLNVADGVWFTIDFDTNTTSGWAEGGVDSTDAWSQGTVALEATQQLQFSGTLQQADGRANAKPVAVSLTGQSLELKKESDNGGKLSVWGNAKDSIRLTAKDAITVDGASIYASGDLALDGSAVTAKNGAQLTADGQKTSTRSITLDAASKADGFTVTGSQAAGGTGENTETGGKGETTPTEQPVAETPAAAEAGLPTGGRLLAGGLVITHQDGTKTSDTTNLNSGDTVRSTAPAFINWDSYTLGAGNQL